MLAYTRCARAAIASTPTSSDTGSRCLAPRYPGVEADQEENAIVASPVQEHQDGFWNDTNMTLQVFQDQDPTLREISDTDFEAAWDRFFDSRR